MFEQIPMPNNTAKKEQTAPGVKKEKRFEPEGEKRKNEQDEAPDISRDLEETAVVDLLERSRGDQGKLLIRLRKNTQRLFEYAVIAGDEENAYIHVCNAKKYSLPEYQDMRKSFLKFTEKILLQGEEKLGEGRRGRLKQLMEEVKSENFAKRAEKSISEEEAGFEEISPFEETGLTPKKIGPETIAADFYGDDTNQEVRRIAVEQTPTLFAQAIEDENEELAFMQLFHAKRYRLQEYPTMRSRFLYLVEYLLNEPDEELGEARQKKLEELREIVKKQTMVEVLTPSRLSEEQKNVLRDENMRVQAEITPALFERTIKERDIIWAYEHLKKARALGLPEYARMRDRFMSLIGQLMDHGYEYYEELRNNPSIMKLPPYEKFKVQLKEWAEDVALERFAL